VLKIKKPVGISTYGLFAYLVMYRMDDFFSELERNLTNVGSSKYWKKEVGDIVIWLSPITTFGQEKVNDLLVNTDSLGLNIINETKRVSLSFSIVGINDIDLREFRDTVPRFPVQGRDGKATKVSLDKFIYHKMNSWSAQYIDDLFSVLTDCLESEQKENLKNIKFENAKDPVEELKELEEKAAEIRSNLGMPKMVEYKETPKPEPTPEKEVEAVSETSEVSPEFDPFTVVKIDKKPSAVEPNTAKIDTSNENLQPIRYIDGKPVMVHDAGYSDEVLDTKSNQDAKSNVNPRFAPSGR